MTTKDSEGTEDIKAVGRSFDLAICADSQGYYLRHLISHLGESKRTWQAYSLVENREWYEAKQIYDSTEEAFVTDLDQVLQFAESKAPDLSRVVAYSLLRAAATTTATNVPLCALQTLAQLGNGASAVRYANLCTDVVLQIKGYATIAESSIVQGQVPLARSAMSHAVDALRTIPDLRSSSGAIAAVAPLVCQIGDESLINELTDVVQSMQDRHYRDWALQCVAEGIAETGDIEHAVTIAEKITSLLAHVQALAAIAKVARDSNPLAMWSILYNARQLASQIRYDCDNAAALLSIAEAQCDDEEVLSTWQSAVEVVENIEGAASRELREKAIEVLQRIADRASKSHSVKVLMRIEDLIWASKRSSHLRTKGLGALGAAYAHAGDIQHAHDLASQMVSDTLAFLLDLKDFFESTEGSSRRFHLKLFYDNRLVEVARSAHTIAVAMAQVGATTLAQRIFSYALNLLVYAQSEAEDSITGYDFAGALRHVAVGLARVNEQHSLQKAISLAQSIQGLTRDFFFRDVANELLRRSRYDQSLELVSRIGSVHQRAITLCALAKTAFELNHVDQAFYFLESAEETARSLEYVPSRESELRNQALVLSSFGYTDRGIDLARTLSHDRRVETLCHIAQLEVSRDPKAANSILSEALNWLRRSAGPSPFASIVKMRIAAASNGLPGNTGRSKQLTESFASATTVRKLLDIQQLARRGRTEEAWHLIALDLPPFKVSNRFAAIDYLLEQGMHSEARSDLLGMVCEIESDSTDATFVQLGDALAQRLAQLREEEGLEKLLKRLQSIGKNGSKASLLRAMILALGKAKIHGLLRCAEGMLKDFPATDDQIRILGALADAHYEVGDPERVQYFLDKGLHLVKNQTEDSVNEYALRDFAMVCARVGTPSQALVVLKSTAFCSTLRAEDTATEIVQLLADTGRIEEAVEVHDFLIYQSNQMKGTHAIILALCKEGDMEGLKELAETFRSVEIGLLEDKEKELCAANLSALATALVNTDEHELVCALLNRIDDPLLQAGSYIEIAEGFWASDQQWRARDFAQDAMGLAEVLPPSTRYHLDPIAVWSSLGRLLAHIDEPTLSASALDHALTAAGEIAQQKSLVDEIKLVGLLMLTQDLLQLEDIERLKQVLPVFLNTCLWARTPQKTSEASLPLQIVLQQKARMNIMCEDLARRYFWCHVPFQEAVDKQVFSLSDLLAKLPPSLDSFKVELLVDAFRWSRLRSQDQNWVLILAFTPVFEQLGLLGSLMERIRVVEAMYWRKQQREDLGK